MGWTSTTLPPIVRRSAADPVSAATDTKRRIANGFINQNKLACRRCQARTFWRHLTVHLPDFTKKRLRLSLETRDIQQARRLRDALFDLNELSVDPVIPRGVVPELDKAIANLELALLKENERNSVAQFNTTPRRT